MYHRLLNTLALPALPLILAQGRRLDRALPRLLPARGPRSGSVDGRGEPLRVLVFGESTAVGVGVDTVEQAMVGHFARMIHLHSGRAVSWEAAGLPGATAGAAFSSVLPLVEATPRDIVLVLLGANDVLARNHAGAFVSDMQALIGGLRARTGGNAAILMSSVPPLGTFPALPQPLRSYLGAWSRWLDLALARAAWRDAHYAPVRIPMQPTLFADDGFHPSPLGYQRWAETLLACALRLKLL
ncbi:MAG TPA: SGNH/GDSL hydrolase family protein [Burkholderiales bacterium]|jgi:lysophospholipase L1-like esterase